MSPAAEIIGFGSVAMDRLLRVDRPFAEGKGRVVEERVLLGGNIAIALVAASMLGAPSAYVGWLSSHPEDEAVVRELRSAGVDLSRAVRAEDARPIRSTILVDSEGERFVAFRDTTRVGAPPGLEGADHASARYLLIDGYAARSPGVLRAAASAGVALVADIESVRGEATEELLALCQHLVLPWGFASAATGERTPPAAVDALWSPHREAVVVTRGGAGAWVRQAGDEAVWHQGPFDARIVDTTGCGDWFHGAYAAALCHGRDPRESVRFAAAAAARAAEHLGGSGPRISRADIERMLAAPGAPRPERVPS